jgi:hypothetical protein
MAENREKLHYDAEELAQYFAGEMPDDEAAALETHLGKCQQCRGEAMRISERSAVWFSWTPEAHQAAAAAVGTARASRHKLWGYFWPGLAVAGATASLVLTMVSLQRSRLLKEESQRLVTADRAAGAASERARQLEQEVIDLQKRIAHLPGPPPRPVETPVTVADARPIISLETGTLGPGKTASRTLTVNAAVPSVRVHVSLPEIGGTAIVDAAVTEGDWRIERRALPVQSEGDGRFVVLVLSAEEVRRLVNRPAQLTLVNRGHASIGTVTMTLLLQ